MSRATDSHDRFGRQSAYPNRSPINRLFVAFVAMAMLAPLMLLSSTPAEAQGAFTSIPFGDTWSYLDDGSNQGTAWRNVGFDDSSWATGAGELGYGDGDEATVVSFGPNANNKFRTTYFRQEFTAPAGVTSAQINVIRDDGIVIYINGVQVGIDNMPTSSPDYLTFATTFIAGQNESTPIAFTVDPALLQAGTNTIAVEIHQATASSSDISFDLQLTGFDNGGDSQPPTVPAGLTSTASSPASLTFAWNTSTDNTAVASYKLYRNGAMVASTSHPSTGATDTGLAPDTTYSYQVSAVDLSGNESALSPAISATTDSAVGLNLSRKSDAGVWQTNGEVKTVTVIGDTVYLGGIFTNVNDGNGASLPRTNLAAIDRITGQPTSFAPVLDKPVWALTGSPDGSTLYVGGNFITVDGQTRKRLAAFDTATGTLSSWKPPFPNRSVRALDTDGATLYVGGVFTKLGPEFRNRLGSYDIASETVTAWAPSANNTVKGLLVDPNKIWAVGDFGSINGGSAGGLAAITLAGALIPGDSPGHPTLAIAGLGDQIFLAVAGPGGGRNQAYNRTTGNQDWSIRVDGNVQAVTTAGGQAYFGGHYRFLDGVLHSGRGLTRHDPATGALDTTFDPFINGARSINSLATDGTRIFLGGDFTRISGDDRAQYAQFSEPLNAPELVSLEMLDADANGFVDTVVADFDSTLAACTAPCTNGVVLTNAPSGATLSSVSTSGSTATLTLSEGTGAPQTQINGFKVEITSATDLRSTSGGVPTVASMLPDDGAHPVPTLIFKTNTGTSGLAEAGDTLRIKLSEPLNPSSVPSTITASIVDNGAGSDELLLPGIAVGASDLGSATYISSGQADFASVVTLKNNNTLIQVTLGACSGDCGELTVGQNRTLTVVPDSSITDLVGNVATSSISKTFKVF